MKRKITAILLGFFLLFALAGCEKDDDNHTFAAQYIQTNAKTEDETYPMLTVINSKEELEDYYNANKDRFDLERRANSQTAKTIGFADAAEEFDSKFFKDNTLVLIVLEEPSADIGHVVKSVTLSDTYGQIGIQQVTSENKASENTDSVNAASENAASENAVSDNTASKSTSSQEAVSENTTSENKTSDNTEETGIGEALNTENEDSGETQDTVTDELEEADTAPKAVQWHIFLELPKTELDSSAFSVVFK